jgi:hypothetical protein
VPANVIVKLLQLPQDQDCPQSQGFNSASTASYQPFHREIRACHKNDVSLCVSLHGPVWEPGHSPATQARQRQATPNLYLPTPSPSRLSLLLACLGRSSFSVLRLVAGPAPQAQRTLVAGGAPRHAVAPCCCAAAAAGAGGEWHRPPSGPRTAQ